MTHIITGVPSSAGQEPEAPNVPPKQDVSAQANQVIYTAADWKKRPKNPRPRRLLQLEGRPSLRPAPSHTPRHNS